MSRTGLSSAEIDVVERARLGHVATITPSGAPHLSPKGTVWVLDGGHQIGFAHIHSHRTVANLNAHPALVVSVVDVFRRRGLVVHGTAQVHEPGTAGFEEAAADYARRRGTLPTGTRAFVVAEVTSWEPTFSPAYDDGTAAEVIEDRWRQFYAAQYSAPGR